MPKVIDISKVDKHQKLQMYMSGDKFERIFKSKALFLPKMTKFEDNLEGGIPIENYLKDSNFPRTLDKAINFDMPPAWESEEDARKRRRELERISQEMASQKFDTPFGKYKSDDFEQLFPRCREWLYVSCWHASEHECSAMWKLYAGKDSVCITTTPERIQNAFDFDSNLTHVVLEPVEYIDHNNKRVDSALGPFTVKSEPYTFEKEVRIVAWDENINLEEKDGNPEKGKVFNIKAFDKLIENIIISPFCHSAFSEFVKVECSKYGLMDRLVDSRLKDQRNSDLPSVLSNLNNAR